MEKDQGKNIAMVNEHKNPAISVVLCVYNGETYLRAAIDSILAQTFTDFELILVNDGSTDGSGDICRTYAKGDPRVVLIDCPTNSGVATAANAGIAKSRAPLIARMDADDLSMPERLACQYAYMMKHPNIAVLGSATRTIDAAGKVTRRNHYPLTPTKIKRALEQSYCVIQGVCLMRKEAILKAGGYRIVFQSTAEDYDLFLRISDLGYDLANLPQPLLNRRIHGNNITQVSCKKTFLASGFALLSHKTRQAGLPDPLSEAETLHIGLLETFPAHLRHDIGVSLFLHDHADLLYSESSAGKRGPSTLTYVWQDYLKRKPQIKHSPMLCSALLILAKAAYAQGAWVMTLCAVGEALRHHPKGTVQMLWYKIKDKILR